MSTGAESRTRVSRNLSLRPRMLHSHRSANFLSDLGCHFLFRNRQNTTFMIDLTAGLTGGLLTRHVRHRYRRRKNRCSPGNWRDPSAVRRRVHCRRSLIERSRQTKHQDWLRHSHDASKSNQEPRKCSIIPSKMVPERRLRQALLLRQL